MKASFRRVTFAGGALLVLILLALMIALRESVKRIAPEEIRERIVATIQSEAKASLLITGSIDLTATVTIENAKTLLPGLLDIDLGSARAMVQVPGRAYYGFDVREIDQERITIRGDTVRIIVPQPKVLSVDANLQELKVWSDKGWLRSATELQKVERTAIRRIDNALARQAAAHVINSAQPRINSADALERMIKPVVIAAGIDNPVFEFELAERLKLEGQ
jgi:hypothetical protein